MRRRAAFALASGAVVVSGLAGALALVRFADDPVALVFQTEDRVVVPLPDRAGRIILGRVGDQRHLVVERLGQPVITTPLVPAQDPAAPLDLRWWPETAQGGPFVQLVEPGGEFVVDLGAPAVVRVLRTPMGLALVSPGEKAQVSIVVEPDQGVAFLSGLPTPAGWPDQGGQALGSVSGAFVFSSAQPASGRASPW